jgi:hypothetical protein
MVSVLSKEGYSVRDAVVLRAPKLEGDRTPDAYRAA